MNDRKPAPPPEDGWYEICLQGRLDQRWSTWFDGLELTTGEDGTTTVRGPVADQAALHGLLARVRDLGVPLISVRRTDVSAVGPHSPPPPPPPSTSTAKRRNLP